MKRQTILLAAFALLVSGVFLWQYFSFAHLEGELERQTTDISIRYTSIIQKDLVPLATAHTPNDTQTRLIAKIQQEIGTLGDSTLSVENRVQSITDLQIAINRFSTVAADMKEFSTDALFAQLQTEIGEHGQVRTLLEDYNTTAVRWNTGVQSDVGSLFNRISGSKRPILPYLRFDGEQEFVPVINI